MVVRVNKEQVKLCKILAVTSYGNVTVFRIKNPVLTELYTAALFKG